MNVLATIASRRGLVSSLLAVAAACARPASAVETVQMPMQAHRGYFSEHCFVLSQGQRLAYEVHTPHAVDFNLHHHPAEGGTVFPDRLRLAARHANEIVAESGGVYCFQAANPEDRGQGYVLTVSYDVSGG
ncbi:MAG TPA: hypothetical protein VIN61_02625 [Gammaproteobacteria bacterium]